MKMNMRKRKMKIRKKKRRMIKKWNIKMRGRRRASNDPTSPKHIIDVK